MTSLIKVANNRKYSKGTSSAHTDAAEPTRLWHRRRNTTKRILDILFGAILDATALTTGVYKKPTPA